MRRCGGRTPQHSSIALRTPYISYDTQAHIYYAVASWGFNGNTAMGQLASDAGYCFGCNVGGYDAFGMAFNHGVTITGEDATKWGSSYCPYYGTQQVPLWSNNSAGDVFSSQDRFNYSVCNSPAGDYSMFNGSAVTDLSASSVTCPLNLRSTYEHTWNAASLSGVTIGYNSIQFSVTNASYAWQRTSSAGIYC